MREQVVWGDHCEGPSVVGEWLTHTTHTLASVAADGS